MTETPQYRAVASGDIASEADRRASSRKSLMLRSAKVVCQTGEYVCLVRDVCELATSLSFMHDVPPEPRILLCLGNGLTYPIERVWADKRQAGYRFASQVSPEEFRHEASPYAARPVRLVMSAPAQIMDGRDAHDASLLDISNHGAKLECTAALQQQRLMAVQVSGMNQRAAKIVWAERYGDVWRYGVQFEHPIALQDLATTALRLQPFNAPAPDDCNAPVSQTRAA